MNTDNFVSLQNTVPSGDRMEKIRREETAEKFEELFARQLVREMTKNSFQMADNHTGMGQANSLYREFITDALAGKLASQRQLGLADLVSQHWSRQQDVPDNPVRGNTMNGPMDLDDGPGQQTGPVPVKGRSLSDPNGL